MKNMKEITTYLSLLSLVFPIMSPAQVSLGIAGGLATYQMNDLKTINTQQAKSLPFETVEVDNFDHGWYLHASLTTKISAWFIAIIQQVRGSVNGIILDSIRLIKSSVRIF